MQSLAKSATVVHSRMVARKHLSLYGTIQARQLSEQRSSIADLTQQLKVNAGLGGPARFQRKNFYRTEYHDLKEAISPIGTIGDLPLWYRFGLVKVTVCICASLFLGSLISKAFVHFLEENDIFKPEDDDDDDDD